MHLPFVRLILVHGDPDVILVRLLGVQSTRPYKLSKLQQRRASTPLPAQRIRIHAKHGCQITRAGNNHSSRLVPETIAQPLMVTRLKGRTQSRRHGWEVHCEYIVLPYATRATCIHGQLVNILGWLREGAMIRVSFYGLWLAHDLLP